MFKRIIVLVFVQIFAVMQIFAVVSAPKLKCISVGNNNEITVTWLAPVDPLGEFVNYEIFQSTSLLGVYSLATTINNYSQLTYTYASANLTIGTVYFFIRTNYNDVTGGQSSNNSDTLQPILITVNGLNSSPFPLENQANVTWNKIHSPKITSHSNWYLIYRKFSGKQWVLIDSTQYGTENYLDSVKVCSDSAYYRVEVKDISGCISISQVNKDAVGDKTPPNIPQIDSVSINPLTGKVQIGWQTGTPGDVGGYIVILELPTGGYQLDTVWGLNNTFFIDVDANSDTRTEIYGLLAFDSCWVNGSPNTSASAASHKTIFLNAELSACERKIKITWSPYFGWNSGIKSYEIYASENGSAASLVASVGGTVASYVHKNLNANSNYCYYVRAIEAGGTGRSSTSNKVCLNVVVPNFPKQQYLNYVTVKADSNVEISCYIDLKAAVQYYNLERSIDAVSGFEIVSQKVPSTNSMLIFVDSTANVASEVYYYRITAVDVCGNLINISNTSNTVLAKIIKGTDEYINEITWNSYSDWETFGGGVSFYNIYKSSNHNFSEPPIAILPYYETFFVDDVSDEADRVGTFCYLIKAVESEGNIYSLLDSSNANIVCATIKPKVYIPNAFSPNDNNLNDVFKPQVSFADPTDYHFAIYNRFGNLIFSTQDRTVGWGGRDASVGVYVYLLRYTDGNGFLQTVRGSVTLIR